MRFQVHLSDGDSHVYEGRAFSIADGVLWVREDEDANDGGPSQMVVTIGSALAVYAPGSWLWVEML